ncbi:uncharacterized protein [Hoplias malabaricus]|uniref:uncharacterized protein n=1 Tax=Hoplias malabaricus TaxID=27720 RepID=UPI0034618DB9
MDCRRLFCSLLISLVSAHVCDTELRSFRNIKSLKINGFGEKYPRHGLLLIYWFANQVSLHPGEDFLRLRFNPAQTDYGFQLYKNSLVFSPGGNGERRALPCLNESMNRVYYSVGSLQSVTIRSQMPSYITQDFHNFPEDLNRDLDRIVVRVQKSRPTTADKVFVTQEVNTEHGRIYDPDQTYEISLDLLKQVQALRKSLESHQAVKSEDEYDRYPLDVAKVHPQDPRLTLNKEVFLDHMKRVGHLKTIFAKQDLRWFLSLAGYDVDARFDIHKKIWACSSSDIFHRKRSVDDHQTLCEGHSVVKLEVRTTPNGCARLIWQGLPKNLIKMNPELIIVKSDSGLDFLGFIPLLGQTSGSINTLKELKNGLQPQLIVYKFVNEPGLMGIRYSIIWRGTEFDSANRIIPSDLSGYDASLQLFTKGGYACTRLYIQKSFIDWKEEFSHSWVGFYASEEDDDNNYYHYQWVSNFLEVGEEEDESKDYLIYEYQSPMGIAPGVQARCMVYRNMMSHKLGSLSKRRVLMIINWPFDKVGLEDMFELDYLLMHGQIIMLT